MIKYSEFPVTSNYLSIRIFLSSSKKPISPISPARIPFPSSALFFSSPLDKGQRAPSFRHVSLSSPYREPLLNERMNISRVRFQPTIHLPAHLLLLLSFPPLPPRFDAPLEEKRYGTIGNGAFTIAIPWFFKDGQRVSNDTFTSDATIYYTMQFSELYFEVKVFFFFWSFISQNKLLLLIKICKI